MKVTLKDGSVKEYAQSMSVYDIALDLSEGLAERTLYSCSSCSSSGSSSVPAWGASSWRLLVMTL